MGAVISIIKGLDKILIYLSGFAFFAAFIILFGITYYTTGAPFGTELPNHPPTSITNALFDAKNLILLSTAWIICPIVMIVSLILVGIFFIIQMGLKGGGNSNFKHK